MRILVNYSVAEKGHLPILAYVLKSHGIQAVSTAAVCTLSELLEKAKFGQCQAILLCNEGTLANCVPGNEPTLDKYRGSRLDFSVPTIVCNKLAHFSTVPHGKWLLDQDIAKLKMTTVPSSRFEFEVLDSVDKFQAALSMMSKAILMATDIETDLLNAPDEEDTDNLEGGDSVITSISWSSAYLDGSITTYVLPFIDFGVDHWETDEDYGKAIAMMRTVNSLPIVTVMQNGMYDATHLIRYHAEPANWQLDTMGMAHAQYAELPQDLAFIASYELYDYVYWKDDADLAKKEKNLRKFWGYNAKDTWHTLRIAIQQLRTMPAYARKNYADQFPLVFPSIYCSYEGLLIDNAVRAKQRTISTEKLEAAKDTLHTMFADPGFNPGSWQQVEKYIYQVFGARRPKIGRSKSCTDEKNLKAVAQQHPLLARIVHEILTYRSAQKAIGTYYDFKQKRGRLLYALDPFGTDTDRMACRASSLWVGTQVQNIPGYAKPMLIADEGYELVEIDNSQSEARCTAYCSRETKLMAALESATHDFYKTLGTLFFNIPYEEVSDFFRNKVLKKIVHGTNYMMGGKTFIENIGIQILYETALKLGIKIVSVPRRNHPEELTLLAFANQLLEAYHVPFPRVREWYKEIYNEVAQTGYLVSPLGHTRKFFGDITKDHKILRGAVAHQPQNLSVTIVNKGYRRVYKTLVIPSKGEYRLKAQVHDSILAQYPIAKRSYYVPLMQECMRNPVVVHGRTLSIPIDAKVGPNWKQMEKYREPS